MLADSGFQISICRSMPDFLSETDEKKVNRILQACYTYETGFGVVGELPDERNYIITSKLLRILGLHGKDSIRIGTAGTSKN